MVGFCEFNSLTRRAVPASAGGCRTRGRRRGPKRNGRNANYGTRNAISILNFARTGMVPPPSKAPAHRGCSPDQGTDRGARPADAPHRLELRDPTVVQPSWPQRRADALVELAPPGHRSTEKHPAMVVTVPMWWCRLTRCCSKS